MSEYLSLNQEFHAFSKSPIKGDQRVANAVNKSGHTITTSEIWSDDIPWFTEVSTEEIAIQRAADARYNDLILLGSNIYVRKGNKTNGASTGTTFAELWEKHPKLTEARAYALQISSGLVSTITTKKVEIKNSNDDVVVEYYVGYPIDLLTFENNSNQSSVSAARMFINNEVVGQFVSSTDKIYKGFPSTGYNVLVYTSTGSGNYTKIVEGETDDDFINNAYAGIIQFNKERVETHNFAASIYKYVGDTLDKAIPKVLSIGTEEKGLSLTEINDIDFTYHYLSLATSYYEISSDIDPTWVYPNYLVTANEVEKFVNLTVGSLEDRIVALQKAGISYKIYIPKKDAELPTPSIEYKNTILLVPEEQKYQDYVPPSAISGGYVEWLCVNKGTEDDPDWAWEQIGTTEADLENYIKLIELNGKQLTVQKNDSPYYVRLGSLVESVKYNELAGTIVQGKTYQNFNESNIPNCKSIKVGISSDGHMAVGVKTATDEVYGLSKMFTSALPSTPATDETTINEHKETAVSVKSASEMYNSLASAIASETPSDEFDIPSFDLNYILQSKINEPWVEEMVITSSDYALQIPHKDSHYTKYKNMDDDGNIGYDKDSIYFNSLNLTDFYEIAEPITKEEELAGIKHRTIATIKKLANGEYDLSSLYDFPNYGETEFTNSKYKDLNEKEYRNLQTKVKNVLNSHLRSQLKSLEDVFNKCGISVDGDDYYEFPYPNSEAGIQTFVSQFVGSLKRYIYLTDAEWDKLFEIDENVKNFKIKITTPSSNISIDNITFETIDRPKTTIQIKDKELTIERVSLTLSEEAKGYLKDYIIKASSHYNLNSDDWQSFLSKTGREAAYKAKWIEDAKNDTIKTSLAFQYQIKTTYDLFRLILINLLGEEQYGKENSLSKKYMKPGITFTCLTRPYNRIGNTVSHYYSYTQNRWKGNPNGKYHDEVFFKNGDIKWDYIPSMYTLNKDATWGAEDSFAHPTHWDTTTNEQKFDCLDDEIKKLNDKVTRNETDIDNLTNRTNEFESSLNNLNNSITNVKQNPIVLQEGKGISITPSTTSDETKQYTIACTYEFDTNWFDVTGTKVSIKEDKLKQVMNAAFADAIDEIEVQVTTTSPIEQVTNGQGKLRMVTAITNLNTHIGDETALIDTSLAAQATTVSETGEVITELVDLNSL